jgi:hypothetical protein
LYNYLTITEYLKWGLNSGKYSKEDGQGMQKACICSGFFMVVCAGIVWLRAIKLKSTGDKW